MSLKNKGAVSAVYVLFFAACTLAQARDTLVITGSVKDSSGAAVAGAMVTVIGGFGGGARDTTDASGSYSITYTPGFFTPTSVTVTATKDTRTGTVTVTVPAGASGRILLTADITLGRFTIDVMHELTPKAILTRVRKPSVGYSIDGRRIVMSPAGIQAIGLRIFREEGSRKVLTIK